ASNIIRSTRTWWVVAGIVSAVFVVVDAEQFGYTLGSAILPMLAIGGCANLYYRVRRALLARKRSRKIVGQITLTVTIGQLQTLSKTEEQLRKEEPNDRAVHLPDV